MIRRDGDRLLVSGTVTLGNASALLREGMAQLAGARVVDLGGVTGIHSALLAVMFAWMREAQRHASQLAFSQVPEGLLTIARLYGVLDALPVEPVRA